jgi:hypothetical protein
MENVGLFHVNLVPFMPNWYISWTFGLFGGIRYIFTILVYCSKRNLATLIESGSRLKFSTAERAVFVANWIAGDIVKTISRLGSIISM